MTDNHAGRALRPLSINIPLKAGTRFETVTEGDTVYVRINRVFDFEVTLSIEDYGTLMNFVDSLGAASEVELQRIKEQSRAARSERSRSQSSVRNVQNRRRRVAKQKSAEERVRRNRDN